MSNAKLHIYTVLLLAAMVLASCGTKGTTPKENEAPEYFGRPLDQKDTANA